MLFRSIAAVPHAVSAAMLHGWHGHNGVSLGNDRLGFVCTGMTVDGLPGLEGYYIEHDRPLKEEERVRFAYGAEQMPRIDWRTQPTLATENWPQERRLKTFRAYAVEYLRTMLPTLQEQLGATDAQKELGRAARLVGLQFHEETGRDMDLPTDVERGDAGSARQFARWLSAILRAQGEEIEVQGNRVIMTGWRIAQGLTLADPLAAFDAWNELWLGAAAAHDRFLKIDTTRSYGESGWSAAWTIVHG